MIKTPDDDSWPVNINYHNCDKGCFVVGFDKTAVIELLNERPVSFIKLAQTLHIKRKDNRDFSFFLSQLVRSGQIFKTFDGQYYLPTKLQTYQGIIRINAKGFGFVDLDEDKSIFVAAPHTRFAMDRDEVKIKAFADPVKQGEWQGVVTDVLVHNRTTFVGRIVQFNNKLGIIPLDAKLKKMRFKISDLNGAKVDDEVKVNMIEYGPRPVVAVDKVLGHKNDVAIDIVLEIEEAGVKYEFDSQTIVAAKQLPSQVLPQDLVGRKDLRDQLIVTIDGDDTKDFDDAISVVKNDRGNYVLGVHIADVSHYVVADQPLDQEASSRGTSIYLADRVIPMLPVALSNGICSLNPRVDRLTITAQMEIDKHGKTVAYDIYPSVINSKYRLTYQQVNQFYRQKQSWDDEALHTLLNSALQLSQAMRQAKMNAGYIDFEIEESKIVLDDQGKTVDIVARDRLESEMMIEDFMVRANETVAEHAAQQQVPFMYRVHDKPDFDRVLNLQNVVKVLGIDVTIPQAPVPQQFAKAINQIKQTRFDDFMKVMMLRTMAKAIYAPKNIGHFGLASHAYTHFTSPIRRYPDLIVHRMLRTYFFEQKQQAKQQFAAILPSVAEHSSAMEQRAIDLERKVADIKKAEFYEHLIGKSFAGTIVSMAKFGFFVEFPNKVDGLVHVSSLVDGMYKLDNTGYTLKSESRQFTVGDQIMATVVNVVKSEGKIDLVPTDLYKQLLEKFASPKNRYGPKS